MYLCTLYAIKIGMASTFAPFQDNFIIKRSRKGKRSTALRCLRLQRNFADTEIGLRGAIPGDLFFHQDQCCIVSDSAQRLLHKGRACRYMILCIGKCRERNHTVCNAGCFVIQMGIPCPIGCGLLPAGWLHRASNPVPRLLYGWLWRPACLLLHIAGPWRFPLLQFLQYVRLPYR